MVFSGRRNYLAALVKDKGTRPLSTDIDAENVNGALLRAECDSATGTLSSARPSIRTKQRAPYKFPGRASGNSQLSLHVFERNTLSFWI